MPNYDHDDALPIGSIGARHSRTSQTTTGSSKFRSMRSRFHTTHARWMKRPLSRLSSQSS